MGKTCWFSNKMDAYSKPATQMAPKIALGHTKKWNTSVERNKLEIE